MSIFHKITAAVTAASLLGFQATPVSAAYTSREEFAFSLRPEVPESGLCTVEENTIYVPLDAAGGMTLRFGMYMEAEYADIAYLAATLHSDSSYVRFTEEGYHNPTVRYTEEPVTYTLPDGTEFSTQFKPYCFGKLNSKGTYQTDSWGVTTRFADSGDTIVTNWTYGYGTAGVLSAGFLGGISDAYSYIDFNVILDPEITAGTYTLSFSDAEDESYITSDIGNNEYVDLHPTLKNAQIVVFDTTPTESDTVVPTETDTAAPTETDTEAPTETVADVIGDVDYSGTADAVDASLILRYAAVAGTAGNAVLYSEDADIEAESLRRGNVNNSENVDAVDASYILVYAAKRGNGEVVSWDEIIHSHETPDATEPPTETDPAETDPPAATAPETTIVPETTNAPETTAPQTVPVTCQLDVACILQNDEPALPTGCEATALAIALNYDGFAVDKTTLASKYLPKMAFSNGLGADYRYVFPGNPTDYSGYGCYAPAIAATADAYFTAQKNASRAQNISGTEFEDLFAYVSAGRPVIFNATMYMMAPETGGTWTTPDGNRLTWLSHEHCLVLTGYDKKAGTVNLADPMQGNVVYSIDTVKERYNQMGKSAVVLYPSSQTFTEAKNIESGAVYTLKNAGSGKYLTVCSGEDSNGVNVIQADGGELASQQFRITYRSESNSYVFEAMCSSDGANRVLDIVKIGGGISGGCNLEIYTPVDAQAQEFILLPRADGTYRISCRSSRTACIAVTGNDTGTASGDSYTSAGNAVMQSYTGSAYQSWILTKVS